MKVNLFLLLFISVLTVAILNTLYVMNQRTDIENIMGSVLIVTVLTILLFAALIGKKDILTNFNRLLHPDKRQ